MRVRGFWPLREDRAIDLPIERVDWLVDGDGDDSDDDDGGDVNNGDGGGRERGGRAGQGGRGRGNGHNQRPDNHDTGGGRHLRSRGPVPDSSLSGKVFTPTNPFTNPVSLQALKKSFAKQPNWKAAIKEGTTWEGNADENAAKWRKLNRIDV